MSNPSQILFTGQYSGTVVNSSKLDDGLIAGITSYTENKFNPEFHYHENPHLSLVLQGGNIENRKSGSIERKAGALIFYRSGELHQTLPATTVSKNINLEIENSFLIKYDISEKNFDCISLGRPQNVLSFVKIYNEIYLNDSLSDTSIQMLTISIINSKKKEATKKPEWAIKLHEVLHDQWDQSHSLDYLSKITNVHPVTISKYFIKAVEIDPQPLPDSAFIIPATFRNNSDKSLTRDSTMAMDSTKMAMDSTQIIADSIAHSKRSTTKRKTHPHKYPNAKTPIKTAAKKPDQ